MGGQTVESEAAISNVVELPFSQARCLIAQTRTDCESLRQSIGRVQRCLGDLEEFIERTDDRSIREKLQYRVAQLNRLLLLRLDELSVTDRLLQEALRHN